MAWVTGEAARAVDPGTGLFVLPGPTALFVRRLGAESVAVAAARWYGAPAAIGGAAAVFEQDRGGSIAFDALEPCARSIYVATPLGALPVGAPDYARRAFASQWAVALCAPGVPGAELSVGVPDAPRHVQVVGTTLTGWDQLGGGDDFDAAGVPPQLPSGLSLTPEDAVAFAARTTGRRVAAVPVAYNRYEGGHGALPLCATWRLMLDGAASFRGDSTARTYQTAEVYVGYAGVCYSGAARLYLPLAEQPTLWPVAVVHDTTGRASGFALPLDTLVIPVVGPVRFEAATAIR